MQQRGRAAAANLLFNGVDREGLNNVTEVKPEQGELEVGERGRVYIVGDGQIKWNPIEGAYIDEISKDHEEFFREWCLGQDNKDVTYIRLDGHGSEIQRILLRDAECLLWTPGSPYDANGITVSMVKFKLGYFEPIFL